jgi:hypothetical protein
MEQKLPSRRRIGRYVWPALLILTLVGGFFLARFSYPITVTEADAQALIDEQVAKLQAENPDYEIEGVTIAFLQNEMVISAAGGYAVRIDAYPEQMVTVGLSATGDPDYRSGGIYFNASAFELERFLINDEEPNEVAKRLLTDFAGNVAPELRDSVLNNGLVKDLLGKAGVSIDTEVNDAAISGAALAAEAIVDEYREEGAQLLEGTVLYMLERTPLYTLGNSWGEMVAMAALSDIGIENGVFTATLSGAKLLWSLFLILAIIAIIVAWVVAIKRGRGDGFISGVVEVAEIGLELID